MIEIREAAFGSADYEALLAVRDRVLRRPIGMVLRDKDKALDHTERHIGLYDSGRAIGCALLRPEADGVVQLRQVAVDDGYRGQGLGARLVAQAERAAREAGFRRIETRARRSAQTLYARLGYRVVEGGFEDEHTLMMSKAL
jgi:GNAT superfamily N-acetyltransferase